MTGSVGRIGRAIPLIGLLVASMGTMGPPDPDQYLVEPYAIEELDALLRVRGGRWRALQRWRNWWERERRPANRHTCRRHLYT